MKTLAKIRKAITDYKMSHGGHSPSGIYLTLEDEVDLYDLDASKVGDTVASVIFEHGPRGLKQLFGIPLHWEAKDFNVA
jgi:hypothetical protein